MFSLKTDCPIPDGILKTFRDKTNEELGLTDEVVEKIVSKVLHQRYFISTKNFSSTFNRIFHMSGIFRSAGVYDFNDQSCIIRFNLPIMDGYEVGAHFQQWANHEAILEGVLTPKILITDTSHKFCDFDFQIMEYLEGQTLFDIKDNEEMVCNVLTQLSKELVKLHKVNTKNFGLMGFDLQPMWELYLDQNIDNHITYLERNGLVEDLLGLIMAYNTGMDKLPLEVESHLLHGDLSYRNIIVKDGNLSGIIDWEDSVFGDPIFDLANLATFHPEKRHKYFIDSYPNKPKDFHNRFWFYFLRISIAKAIHRHRFGYNNNAEEANKRISLAIEKINHE